MTYYAIYLERDPDGRPDALFQDKDQAIEWGYVHALMYVSLNPIRLAGMLPITRSDFSSDEWVKKMEDGEQGV